VAARFLTCSEFWNNGPVLRRLPASKSQFLKFFGHFATALDLHVVSYFYVSHREGFNGSVEAARTSSKLPANKNPMRAAGVFWLLAVCL
jgi:hypothetical protein